jgi:rhomboid protease GluP
MTPTPQTGEMIEHAVITALSKRQAMDWSLVLASQGIEPVIQFNEERGKWELLVLPAEFEKSQEAIRLYRVENRGWAWRHELPGADLEIHAGALFWSFVLIAGHWIASEIYPQLELLGRMDSLLVRKGEWWRLFTAVMLHSDLAHLMANVSFGVLILGLAMARFGPGLAILASYIGGVAGNLVGLALYPRPYTGVGASGMMMGALGLLCVHSAGLWRKNPQAARYVGSGVLAGVVLFALFGLNPASDILAHIGGFVSGLLFGAPLAFLPEKRLQSDRLNQSAFGILILFISLTWALALK